MNISQDEELDGHGGPCVLSVSCGFPSERGKEKDSWPARSKSCGRRHAEKSAEEGPGGTRTFTASSRELTTAGRDGQQSKPGERSVRVCITTPPSMLMMLRFICCLYTLGSSGLQNPRAVMGISVAAFSNAHCDPGQRRCQQLGKESMPA